MISLPDCSYGSSKAFFVEFFAKPMSHAVFRGT